MAKVEKFSPKADRLAPPKRLTAEGRAEWQHIVRSLRQVGTLERAKRSVILRYVHRFTECDRLRADATTCDRLVKQLKRMQTRASGADAKVLDQTICQLREQWFAIHGRELKLSNAMRRFFHTYMLTPAARAGLPFEP